MQILDLIKALKEGYYEKWQEASKVIATANIKSQKEYKKRYKRISLRLHSNPQMIYTDFPGWKIFLGTKYQTWEEASTTCIKLKVKSCEDYERVRNFRLESRDNKLPPNPENFYPDFPGWKTFLGFKNPWKGWIEWDELIKENDSGFAFILKLHNIETDQINSCFFWKKDKAVKYVRLSEILPLLKEYKGTY